MKVLFLFLVISTFSFTISPKEVISIGDKIWKNECGSTLEGLVHWNKAEEFPSLGIGHFIWFPEGYKGPFEETFPSLLQFLQKEGAIFPSWLTKYLEKKSSAPWSSYEEFLQKKNSSEVAALREMLFETRGLQALFIAKRLESAALQIQGKKQIYRNLQKLLQNPKSLYAVIDYVNFKGTGLSSSEVYKSQGWGLVHVLERIPESSLDVLGDFVKEAKKILLQRVQNAPKERGEERWLKGWYNRLDSYLL